MVELDARDARAGALRWPARRIAPALVVVGACVWTLAVRGVDHHFISFSDGVYTYIASAVAAHGPHALYRTIVLSQPPAVVLGAAALWRLSPHVETIRLALALLSVLTALMTYAVARANRLSAIPAAAAALVAVTGPVHAQFSGLDGEALLAPLALGLALALQARRPGLAGVLVGAGFFVKLTWLPFAVAGLVVVARTRGQRALGGTLLTTISTAGALYGASLLAFGWKPGDLLAEIVLGQRGSGLQPGMLGWVAALTVLVWWPLLPLAVAGGGFLVRPSRALLVAGLVAGLFAVKQGTFFNVLDPAEPFLAVAATAGALHLWRGSAAARWLVAICVAGIVLHTASLTGAPARRALPLPVGAALASIDDEGDVDRAARAIESSSKPTEPVLVNPLLALVAGRKEVAGQADWFILRALGRSCGGTASAPARCRLWGEMKRRARHGGAAVVGVDSNVRSFDGGFGRDAGVARKRRLLRIDSPPLDLTLYGR